MDRRRRHVLAGEPSVRGGPAGPGPIRSRRLDRRTSLPPPFNVRTRVHEYGGGSYVVAGGVVVFSNFADGRLYRARPGRRRARRHHPRRSVALRRPAFRPGSPAVPGRPRGPSARTGGCGAPAGGGHRRRAARRPGRADRPVQRARTSSRRPALAPGGSRLAWLEWDHPDMPWDASRLRMASDPAPMARSANRSWSPAAPTSRSPSPNGPPTGPSTSSRIAAAGGTSIACWTGRRSTRWHRWRPSSPIPPGSSGARRTPSRPTARSWRSPGATAATG